MTTTAQDRKLFSLRIAQRLLESSRRTGGSGVYLACAEVEDLVEMATTYHQSTTTASSMPCALRRPAFQIFQRLRVLLFPRLPKPPSSNFPELEDFRAR